MTEREAVAYLKELGYKVSRSRPSSRTNRHRHCISHERVAGYREPVCVLTGQDRSAVIRFAVEVADIARRAHQRVSWAA